MGPESALSYGGVNPWKSRTVNQVPVLGSSYEFLFRTSWTSNNYLGHSENEDKMHKAPQETYGKMHSITKSFSFFNISISPSKLFL